MGQIGSYTEMSAAPAVDDLLFIADASSSNQIMKIQTSTLHKAPVFMGGAAGGNLSLGDGDGDIGITLEDGGNVGIGNTSPASKLDIKTTASPTDASQALLRLYATASDSYPYMEFRNDVRRWKIYAPHGSYNNAFTIYDQTVTAHRLSILADGKTGISNVAPSDLLTVGAAAAVFILMVRMVRASRLLTFCISCETYQVPAERLIFIMITEGLMNLLW